MLKKNMPKIDKMCPEWRNKWNLIIGR
jgi:hypothetical protein